MLGEHVEEQAEAFLASQSEGISLETFKNDQKGLDAFITELQNLKLKAKEIYAKSSDNHNIAIDVIKQILKIEQHIANPQHDANERERLCKVLFALAKERDYPEAFVQAISGAYVRKILVPEHEWSELDFDAMLAKFNKAPAPAPAPAPAAAESESESEAESESEQSGRQETPGSFMSARDDKCFYTAIYTKLAGDDDKVKQFLQQTNLNEPAHEDDTINFGIKLLKWHAWDLQRQGKGEQAEEVAKLAFRLDYIHGGIKDGWPLKTRHSYMKLEIQQAKPKLDKNMGVFKALGLILKSIFTFSNAFKAERQQSVVSRYWNCTSAWRSVTGHAVDRLDASIPAA